MVLNKNWTWEEIEQLIRDKSSKSTNKATLNAVKTLRDFCKEQNLDESFQELRKTDLNSLLPKFYTSARKCNGSYHSKSSWVGIRYGIHCQILATGKEFKNYPRRCSKRFVRPMKQFRRNYTTEKAGEGESKSPSWNNTNWLTKALQLVRHYTAKRYSLQMFVWHCFLLSAKGQRTYVNIQSERFPSRLILKAENMCTKKLKTPRSNVCGKGPKTLVILYGIVWLHSARIL